MMLAVQSVPDDPRRPKHPRDTNQLAKAIVDIATGERDDTEVEMTDAQKFARQGGLKGGRARAEKLSSERRREIAKKAAQLRWAAKSDKN